MKEKSLIAMAVGLGHDASLQSGADVDPVLALTGLRTGKISAHIASGRIHQNVCAGRRCLFTEMPQPTSQCPMDHVADCTETAIRFRGQDYRTTTRVQVAP